MFNWISNKAIVKYSPILTSIFIEGGVISQLLRMWGEGAAADQSLIGWILVWCALLLWFNWYRVFTPEQKWAKWSTIGGLAINTVAIFTVIWYRFLV